MNLLKSWLDIIHGTRSEWKKSSKLDWISEIKIEHLLPKPTEMNFDSGILAATCRTWKQTIQLHLDAAMSGKTEEQQYSTFLFVIGEWGREIFNTFTWNKKTRDGVETEEDDILVKALFQKFEDYCLPKKNLIAERRGFLTRNQHDETIDTYITQLRNLSSPWEFRDVKKGLILYKLFNGIQSNKIPDNV